MNDIIEDLFKIYLSCIDSYNSKIHQTLNDKYTIIDKAMLAVYIFVKIIEERNEKNEEITDALSNYLLRQIIYSETGSLDFKIKDNYYGEILENLISEKFEYKNRLMKKIKYEYKKLKSNKYLELLKFLENISEIAIFNKMLLRGNREVIPTIDNIKEKLKNELEHIEKEDYFYEEKTDIINSIIKDEFKESEYGKIIDVALNLRDVFRYSSIPAQIPENVLFHQYTVAVISYIFAKYCNENLKENIDIYTIISKSLFHDFGEYKGTEIVTQFKNYNEITKKMFKEIELEDEKDLKDKLGEKIYKIIIEANEGSEGYIAEVLDKILGIMKLWIEAGYYHNYTFIKTINSIYQDRFKRFLKIENISQINNKTFFIDLLRESYIYIKERLVEENTEYFLKYFTKEDLKQFRDEISMLKIKPESFLK